MIASLVIKSLSATAPLAMKWEYEQWEEQEAREGQK